MREQKNITIKIDLYKALSRPGPVRIELGCGPKKKSGRIGVDTIDMPGVDIVADLEKGLVFLPDNCIDEIYCKSILEHIDNFESLMREIVRVLKDTGRAFVFVPHFSNPYYYSDYTHKRTFGLYSFYYFVDREHQLKRKVPEFYTDIRIRIVSSRLIFRSPFWFRKQLKKLEGLLFNSCRYLQEFYEENLCYKFPCYGVEIVFEPVKTPKFSE